MESAGRAVDIWSESGLIRAMALRHPRYDKPRLLVRYDYNDRRELVAVRDPLDKPYLFYYQNGRLKRHRDRVGLSFYYEYDSQGRCVHAFGDGGLYNYRFDYLENKTEFTNSLGYKKTLKYDWRQLPILECDDQGELGSYEYDEEGRTVAVTDGGRHRTEYGYDERGNLTRLTRPDGTVVTTEYDERNRPLRIVDPNQNVWRQVWTTKGLLAKQISPSGAQTRYEYDRFGQLTALVNPTGYATRLEADEYGNVVSFTDAMLNVTKLAVDDLGNVVRETSPGGKTTSYRYDAKSRIVGIRNPSGTEIRCTYDDEDNLTYYRDEAGNETRLEYKGLGEVSRRINPDGTEVRYERDAEEQLIAVVNERGQYYELVRDKRGNVVEEVDYWGGQRKYVYDKAGFLASVQDALGRTTKYKNDALGRLTKKLLFDGSLERFAYDSNGNLVEHENDCAKSTRIYDSENRLVKEQLNDSWVENEFDENGNRTKRKSSNGTEISFDYDGTAACIGVQINDEPPIQITRDAEGRTVKERLAETIERKFEYNEDGLLTRQTTSTSDITAYEMERRYTYDQVGNLTGKLDSEKGKTFFSYDPMGRVVKHVNPRQKVKEFLYDPAGDLLKSNHEKDPETKTRKSTHDGVDYVFDEAGNLVERKGKGKQTTFTWDGSDRLIEAKDDKGQVTQMGYDVQGRRVYKKTGEKKIEFSWDGDHLLFDKDEWGHVREFVYYPGTFEPLALIRQRKNSDKKETYYYQNDVVGLPQELTNEYARPVWSADYGAFGAVEKFHENEIDNPLRFQGQYYDEEFDLNYNRFRYYDPAIGSFISQDPIVLAAGHNSYRYAPNHWAWIDPLGLKCSKKILDDVGPLSGKKKSDIRNLLDEQGFSKITAHNGGDIWTKAGSDGKTVSIRLDPPSGKPGFADNIHHAHKEIVPTDKILDGNYKPKHASTFDDLGNQTAKTDWDANHIGILP